MSTTKNDVLKSMSNELEKINASLQEKDFSFSFDLTSFPIHKIDNSVPQVLKPNPLAFTPEGVGYFLSPEQLMLNELHKKVQGELVEQRKNRRNHRS